MTTRMKYLSWMISNKPNFAKIPYYPNDAQKKPISLHYKGEIKGIISENYYLFN